MICVPLLTTSLVCGEWTVPHFVIKTYKSPPSIVLYRFLFIPGSTAQAYAHKQNAHVPVKYYYFFFDSQLTGLIQNKTKYCHIKAFYKTRTTSGTIFSADLLISGGHVIFQYKPGAYLLKLSLLKSYLFIFTKLLQL